MENELPVWDIFSRVEKAEEKIDRQSIKNKKTGEILLQLYSNYLDIEFRTRILLAIAIEAFIRSTDKDVIHIKKMCETWMRNIKEEEFVSESEKKFLNDIFVDLHTFANMFSKESS